MSADAFVAPPLDAIEPVVEAHSPSTAYLRAKRSLDVALALLAILVTLPLWFLVAVAVRFSSRGPVFFRQSRVGQHGRTIMVFKFRSMCSDAEARLSDPGLYDTYVATGYKLPVAHECRVTKVGRFLRRSSLDELPQLFNVLRGDMSLVGPRPVLREELKCYGELVDCYLSVRPGITGMWQVNGRSHVLFPARAHLDRDYFLGRSLRLDLSILARTPLTVLRGEGAF